MERLTSNKATSDMSMIELAYNCCYADNDGNARYRNYGLDIDSRKFVRSLIKDICEDDLSDMTDEEFDEYMSEMLSIEPDSQIGLLALFYRNLWAMADLRERLKYYEDLELDEYIEQGRLLKLPCSIGDILSGTSYACLNLSSSSSPSIPFSLATLRAYDIPSLRACSSLLSLAITYSLLSTISGYKNNCDIIINQYSAM
jgi:hypothetical protein